MYFWNGLNAAFLHLMHKEIYLVKLISLVYWKVPICRQFKNFLGVKKFWVPPGHCRIVYIFAPSSNSCCYTLVLQQYWLNLECLLKTGWFNQQYFPQLLKINIYYEKTMYTYWHSAAQTKRILIILTVNFN